VRRHIRRLVLIALAASLAAGCGGDSRQLGNGSWYGNVVAVNVQQKTLTFLPVCRFDEPGRWVAVPAASRVPTSVTLAPRADLGIYYRPNGNAAEGRGQSATLELLADVALHGSLPVRPPGWLVTIQEGAGVSVSEDSGIRSSGKADRRTFACVWSRSTQALVSR
jgi:hypothetical protein